MPINDMRSPLDFLTDKCNSHTKLDEIFSAIEQNNEQLAMRLWCDLAHIVFNPRIKVSWEMDTDKCLTNV